MLVLSRKTNEGIYVGDFLVTITEINDETVVMAVSKEGKTSVSYSKKKNESFSLTENSTIVVIEIRRTGNGPLKVRLGVEAPKETPVYRKEVLEAIRRNETALEESQDT